MAQLISITSEALQAAVRRLLPSQQGFGEDLQASNVITPVINLTPDAEGTTTPEILQTALAFGSNTNFTVNNTTVTLTNTPGFYRVTGTYSLLQRNTTVSIQINDGATDKTLWSQILEDYSSTEIPYPVGEFDYVFFLRSGDTLKVESSSSNGNIQGSFRQIADVNGILVQPVGFTPQ